jgi:hypothetical protein
MKRAAFRSTCWLVALCILSLCSFCSAVTSSIHRHKTAGDFLGGKTDKTVVNSQGEITLALKADEIKLGRLLDNVWMINTLVTDDEGAVYLGTSPNGAIIKYGDRKAEQMYPVDDDCREGVCQEDGDAKEPFSNEHVFAMGFDFKGRLLAGISGDNCRLVRFDGKDAETVFSDKTVRYIFAVVTDVSGNIYLGTGPEGRVYRLDPAGKKASLVYDARDNNILSLAVGKDGYLYAGCDQRGLVYKINQKTKTATVLYDSQQDEITELLLDDDGNVYAAATSAQVMREQVKKTGISADEGSGRPDSPVEKKAAGGEGSAKLEIANTETPAPGREAAPPPPVAKGALPKSAGRVYKITPEGFVTDVFSEMAVFYALAQKDGRFLLATGNNAQLYSINADTEAKSVIYEDKQSSQMTAIAVGADGVYLGCANPARLIRLQESYVSDGTYTSTLIDAGQPARWGKLQIDADLPKGCSVSLSVRSGNVDDPNDPAFSAWTGPVMITKPVQLKCPAGRFCQYRLTLRNTDKEDTPLVREVAVSHVVGNLAPTVMSVKAMQSPDKNKPGVFDVIWAAADRNRDALTYKLEFRKVGRSRWTELKDELSAMKYEWDTRTVEDGRYEVKVTAGDAGSNESTEVMTGSRVSDAIVIDNTPPIVKRVSAKTAGDTATLKFQVVDEFTAVGSVSYTVNSSESWKQALPVDSVYDTTSEDFVIVIEDLEAGDNVVAFKIADHTGNTVYKSYDIEVK